ncbi:glutathione S-transferase [Duganella rhizosphaerae]
MLAEKGVPYERRDVDLAAKPDWFLAMSPLGKTPVLLTDGVALFESAVICEYLDETHAPRLHPSDALLRAQQRSWMEFGSALLNLIGGFYNAADQQALAAKAAEIHARFEQVEAALGEGPYFMGGQFGMVDAVFGPVFRYVDVFDTIADFGMLAGLPRTAAWRAALAARPSVRQAVPANYPDLLRAFLLKRGAALSARMAG